MFPFEHGDWVRFEDHQAEVARIQALESEFHNIDDVVEIRRLREDRASAIDRLTPLGLENERLRADLETKVAARNKWMKDCVKRGAEINRLRQVILDARRNGSVPEADWLQEPQPAEQT